MSENRIVNQFQIRIVKKGGRLPSPALKTVATDEFGVGTLVSRTDDRRVVGLIETIDSNIAGPVSGIAVDASGGEGEAVLFQEINADTILVGQIASGSAEDVGGKRGKLLYDGTTGNYRVDLSTAANASIEAVDDETYFHGDGHPQSGGNYNLVYFKFLPVVLDKAPATVAS